MLGNTFEMKVGPQLEKFKSLRSFSKYQKLGQVYWNLGTIYENHLEISVKIVQKPQSQVNVHNLSII